ncbi:hypothetical protein ABID99_001249 [Mucilaginibacter sp. OAE612]|uniref:hypothetical protein n=2 Tax=unclassified Mucilaginibacter TaxID=2617802 RepID=UPI00359E1795
MMKEYKKSDPTRIVIRIFFVCFLIFTPFVIWQMRKTPSPAERILNEAQKMSFHGRIDSICFDRQNHNAIYLILTDGFRYPLYEHWQFRVQKGDSLAKDSGDYVVHVVRSDGKIDTLDYQKLIKIYQ